MLALLSNAATKERSWPHAAILGDLATKPAMAPAELGATVVHRYVESYRHGGETATQSAIDLGQLDDLVEAVDLLARRLLASLKSAALTAAIRVARGRTVQFFDGLYVDLHHLASNLAKAAGPGPIADACFEIQHVIDSHNSRSPIIAEAHAGPGVAQARGLSLYFPRVRDASVYYRELDLARRTRWADFLDAYPGEDRT